MTLTSKLNQLVAKQTPVVAGQVVDRIVSSKNERERLKKELVAVISEHSGELLKIHKEVMLAEMQGTRLQRSWRPMLMIAFGFIIIYEYFLSKIFGLPPSDIPVQFWNLMEIGMGGFVVGRSLEKISNNILKSKSVK